VGNVVGRLGLHSSIFADPSRPPGQTGKRKHERKKSENEKRENIIWIEGELSLASGSYGGEYCGSRLRKTELGTR